MTTKKPNKILYGDDVLIDLTSDTAIENSVLKGYTFHKADGNIVTGICEPYELATVTPETILEGYKAYNSKGELIVGTYTFPHYTLMSGASFNTKILSVVDFTVTPKIAFVFDTPPIDVSTTDYSAEQDGTILGWASGDTYYIGQKEVGGRIFAPSNCNNMFKDFTSLTSLDLSNFDTSNVTNMSYMFTNCYVLTSLDVSNFDTSNVTNMQYLFYRCESVTSLDVSNFDTSNVTNMGYMFYRCESITSLDVSNFDTSNVTNMLAMFACKSITSLDLSNFDTSNVTNMSFMFQICYALTNLDVSNFDTSNVTNMNDMFFDCKRVTELNLTLFNFDNVTNFGRMLQTNGTCTAYVKSEEDKTLLENNANPSSGVTITVKE